MKRLDTRRLMVAGLFALGAAGVASPNAGCSSGESGGGGGTGGGGGHVGHAGAAGAVAPVINYTFDSDLQTWALTTYVDSNYVNLGAATEPDSGVSLDGGTLPTVSFDDSAGQPDPGAMKVTASFTDFKQYVDVSVNIPAPKSLVNRVLHAKVELVSGTFSGGVQLHVSSGLTAPNDYVYVGQFFSAAMFTAGSWTDIAIEPQQLTPFDGRTFDPSQIVQVGLQFSTGDPAAGGVAPAGDVVFEVDTISG
jgi:hypothetical protein